jgi:hypothetical protein
VVPWPTSTELRLVGSPLQKEIPSPLDPGLVYHGPVEHLGLHHLTEVAHRGVVDVQITWPVEEEPWQGYRAVQ